MHIAIAAGINPFQLLDEAAVSVFSDTAATILKSARLITSDHHRMNAALVSGEIDFHISGGPIRLRPHVSLGVWKSAPRRRRAALSTERELWLSSRSMLFSVTAPRRLPPARRFSISSPARKAPSLHLWPLVHATRLFK